MKCQMFKDSEYVRYILNAKYVQTIQHMKCQMFEDSEYVRYILNAKYVQTIQLQKPSKVHNILPEVVPSCLVWMFEIFPFARTQIQI